MANEDLANAFSQLEDIAVDINENKDDSDQTIEAFTERFDQTVDEISYETVRMLSPDDSSSVEKLIEDFRNDFKKDFNKIKEPSHSLKKCGEIAGAFLGMNLVQKFLNAYVDDMIGRVAKTSSDATIDGAKAAGNYAVAAHNNLVERCKQENISSVGPSSDAIGNLLNFIQ